MQGSSRAGSHSEHSKFEARGRSLCHLTAEAVVSSDLLAGSVTKEVSVAGTQSGAFP